LVIEGQKSFSSGSVDADWLIVSATDEQSKRLVVLALPATRPGIRALGDWDNMGQRQTDSGTVSFENVAVSPHEILATPGPLGSTFASLRPLIAQLTLSNVYLGLAEGALAEVRQYTLSGRRAWPGSGVESAAQDPYVLHRYGEFYVATSGARALADRAAAALETAYQKGDALSPEERAGVSVEVALAKVASTRAALQVTSELFDVAGARATTARLGLDRFWRNARTHTLHDPVDYKLRELGQHALLRQKPEPSFYS
jgi:alkylation response protein AidB-like acyl-CoA dehydrogenase